VLRDVPWIGEVSRIDGGLIVQAPETRASDITRVLAEHGIYLSRLQPREQSLEQYFLDVTGEPR
jgi:hypothetical protein